jgi:GTP-binding protein Era
LNKTVRHTLQTVDVVLFLVEAGNFGEADEAVMALLPDDVPAILVVSKTDRLRSKSALFAFVEKIIGMHPFPAVIPVSARKRFQLRTLEEEIRQRLPVSAAVFSPNDVTDRSERFMASEIVREKIFRFCGDELPYTSTVVIEQYEKKERLRRIFTAILVERDTHKAMIIGRGGERLKEMSSEARADMEKMFGVPVYLEIWVKVKSGWADNEAGLRAYGYE